MRKILTSLLLTLFVSGCAETMALLGPASTSLGGGNVAQTAISTAVNISIKKQTGKTPMENVIEIASTDKNNIQKKTLESEDFKNLVISKVKKTNTILKNSNQ